MQIWEGLANMRIVRGGHSWQLGSITSLARETMGGEILVAVWPKHGLRSDLRVPNLKKISWGSLSPDSHLTSTTFIPNVCDLSA